MDYEIVNLGDIPRTSWELTYHQGIVEDDVPFPLVGYGVVLGRAYHIHFVADYVSDVSSINFLGGGNSNIFSRWGFMIQFEDHIFQMGGSTTQLVLPCFF